MLFRQLFDQDTSTYTYLLADEANREAVIIDPVVEQVDRDTSLIEELELRLSPWRARSDCGLRARSVTDDEGARGDAISLDPRSRRLPFRQGRSGATGSGLCPRRFASGGHAGLESAHAARPAWSSTANIPNRQG